MFFDVATIWVKAGDGGNGSASFRHEKFVPLGGPDGGDGGRGGTIYLVADPELNTLFEFQRRRRFKGESGGNGSGAKRHGAAGDDLEVKVPVGTVVMDQNGETLGDLLEPGSRLEAARGGRGGLGNVHFATATNQAPRVAQRGEPGEERELKLELRLVADVGIIGLPNAGKSTFLASVTRARPKIADYPFTTLAPNLGVASIDEHQSMVLADIPGLIEGAHAGAGLGHEFLRHVTRTLVLIHVVDGSAEDPLASFHLINREMEQYDPDLMTKPRVIAINKQDLTEARDNRDPLVARFESLDLPTYPMSAATGEGVRAVLAKAAELLAEARAEEARQRVSDERPVVVIRPGAVRESFSVTKDGDGYRVSGRQVERVVAMTYLENEESLVRLQRTLSRLGVTAALEAAGVRSGDIVRFGKVELEWI